jgi:hypothetical protein
MENEMTLTEAFEKEMKATPWYLMSAAIHCIVAVFFMCILTASTPVENSRLIIITDIIEEVIEAPQEPEPEIVEDKPIDPIVSETVADSPVIVTTTNIEISDTMETEDNMDDNKSLGEQDNISDVDSEFKGTPALMGIGDSGGGGGGGKLGWRDDGGQKNKKIRDNGGDKKTESAVDWALRWLAAHQEYDGHWDCQKYNGEKHDVAVTSLSLLAFLGAGNSEKKGKYKDNVTRASDWLVKQMDNKGNIGPFRYETPIAAMALVESYSMGGNKYKQAAQKAISNLVSAQCETGGWDYSPNSKRSDTSVSGWAIMALKSAKVSYIEVPDDCMKKAADYFQKATTAQGESTSYASEGGLVNTGGGSERMTAVALTCLQFLGVKREDVQVQGSANKTISRLPNVATPDLYLTYYQSLGLFQLGVRGDLWKKFNPPMKESLLATQVKVGTFQENKGSWNPEPDIHGKSWGRVGETALAALILEIYYRYKEIEGK